MIAPCFSAVQPRPSGTDGLARDRRRGLPHLARPGFPLHPRDQLPPVHRTSVHADDFLYTLQSTCQAALHHGNRVTVATNGRRVLPGDPRHHPFGDPLDQHGVLHLSAGQGGRRFHRGAVGARASRRQRHDRRGRDRQLQPVGASAAAAAPGGLPGGVLSADGVASAGASEQSDAPRVVRHRRQGRVRRGRGDRRLVDVPVRPSRQALARHDGAHRGPDRRSAAGRRRRELARVLRRDPDGAGIFSSDLEAAGETHRLRDQEFAVGPRHGVAGGFPAPDGRGRPPRPYADAVFPPRSCAAPRAGQPRPPRCRGERDRSRDGSPTSAGCGSRAAGCGGSCSRRGCASTSTSLR